MKVLVKLNKTSKTQKIFIQNSSLTTGLGLGSLVYNTSSLTAYYIKEGDSSTTAISLATATLGTWTSGGFIVVDGTNMLGTYEVGLPNACFTALGSVIVYLQGATNMAPVVLEIQVVAFDPDDAVHLGLSALPNTACTTNASLLTSGTGTDQLSVTSGRIDLGKALGTAVTLDTNNVLNVSTKYLAGTTLTGRDIGASVLLSSGTGTGQLDFTSGVVKANVTQFLGTTSAGTAGYAGIDWGHINAPTTTVALSGTTIATVTGQLTAAQVATGVWQDTTAGDFTTAGSIGKSLFTSGNVPGAASGLALVGSNMGTATSVTGTVGGIAGTTQTLDALQTALNSTHGAGSWATATGFAVPGDAMTLTGGTITAIGAQITSDHGSGSYLRNTEPPAATDIADQILIRDWNTTVGAVGQPARRSLMSAARKLANKIDVTTTPGFLTVFREDDATLAYTQAIVVSATAELITSTG